jgi:hypothetical protein
MRKKIFQKSDLSIFGNSFENCERLLVLEGERGK